MTRTNPTISLAILWLTILAPCSFAEDAMPQQQSAAGKASNVNQDFDPPVIIRRRAPAVQYQFSDQICGYESMPIQQVMIADRPQPPFGQFPIVDVDHDTIRHRIRVLEIGGRPTIILDPEPIGFCERLYGKLVECFLR